MSIIIMVLNGKLKKSRQGKIVADAAWMEVLTTA
jgi:hypothetical protein